MKKIIIIGCGAAGMAAAVFASRRGACVTVYEKNDKPGKKLYITGKGRCNFTNVCEKEELLANTVSNPKFLFSAYDDFTPEDAVKFFEELDMRTKVERGRRAFPASDHSSDVIKALSGGMKKNNVTVKYDTAVRDIVIRDGKACAVVTDKGTDEADAVIVATGGLSYPSTGSTGDGYKFAEKSGIRVTALRPALVPLVTEEEYISKLQGLSLKNVTLTVKKDKKVLFSQFGEMMFTHYGISGPIAISASSCIGAKLEKGPLRASIDLKPALTYEQLDARLLREFDDGKNRLFKTAAGSLFPAKLRPVIIELSGIDPEKPVNSVTRQERRLFSELIKNLSFTVVGLKGYNEAVITQGGVSVKEIDPGTMESKKIRGLYFIGEVLDVDAYTGGYNLQIAWSTAYKAAKALT